MDNRIFNVNGSCEVSLLAALKLVFSQKCENSSICCGWAFDKQKGLILLWWHNAGDLGNKFPAPLTAEECLPFVKAWLKTEDAAKVELKSWDRDYNHDGSNGTGWRVYVEDWGKVGNYSAICAITPAFMWYGK